MAALAVLLAVASLAASSAAPRPLADNDGALTAPNGAAASNGAASNGAPAPSGVEVTGYREKDHLHWGYDFEVTGANHWGEMVDETGALVYPDCNGKTQSPISLPECTRDGTQTLGAIKTPPAKDGIAMDMSQSHGAPKFSCPENTDCGKVTVDGTEYALASFHFHSPSENVVDGRLYPLEMHMVHQSEEGGYAVVGVFFEFGDKHPEVDEQIALAWESMEAEEAADADATGDYFATDEDDVVDKILSQSKPLNLASLYDKDSLVWTWDGSFTTPPCTEGVKWIEQVNVFEIDQSRQIAFWDHIGGYPGNARPYQPLNERVVAC